jgi:hypothetical protein
MQRRNAKHFDLGSVQIVIDFVRPRLKDWVFGTTTHDLGNLYVRPSIAKKRSVQRT